MITEIRVIHPVLGLNTDSDNEYTYTGTHARYRMHSPRGQGIEVWHSYHKLTFIPLSNIAYIKEDG